MAEIHSINRQKFDIRYYDQRGVHQLQNKVRSISGDSLQRKIQSVLDEFSDQDATIRLNRIELNIGRIKENELETEIVERVGKQLREYLSDAIPQLKANTQSDQGSIVHNTARKIDLLAYFLHHGVLPWWSNAFGNINLQGLIKELLQGTAKDLIALVRRNGASRNFIQRLVITFDDPTIFSLIEKLEPAEAKTILEIGKDTIRVQRENQTLKTSQQAFRNKVWEFILIYLLNDRGSYFNTKDFTRSLLYQLAGYFNISFEVLIAQFYHAILHLQKQITQTQALASIIKSIYLDEVQPHEAFIQSATAEEKIPLTTQELLSLIQSGKVKLADLAKPRYKSGFEQLLKQQNIKTQQILLNLALRNEHSELLQNMQLSRASRLDLNHLLTLTQAHEKRNLLIEKALFEYLHTGSIASDRSGISTHELSRHLKELISTKQQALKELIDQHGKKAGFRDKLLRLLEEPEIKQLISLIEPSGASAIFGFAEQVQNIKEEGKLKISTSHRDFKTLKWRFILEALLVDRGTRFNLKSFVRSSLTRLAAHLNLPPQTFIGQILLRLKSLTDYSATGDLVSVLSELQGEELTAAKRQKARKQRAAHKLTKLKWLEYVITKGALPWWSKEQGLKPSHFQQILIELGTTSPKPIKRILRAELVKDRKRKFTLSLLDEEGKVSIIKLIQPQALKPILLYTRAIKKLEQQTEASSDKLNIQQWDTIIFTLIKDRGSVFNLKSFILQTLHQMSHHFNMNFKELFTTFLHISEASLSQENNDFKQAILDLKNDFEVQSQKSSAGETGHPQKNDDSAGKLSLDGDWLHGVLKDFNSASKLSPRKKAQLLRWVTLHKHISYATLLAIFEQSGIRKKQIELFFEQFNKQEQKALQPVFKNARAIQADLKQIAQKTQANEKKTRLKALQSDSQKIKLLLQNTDNSIQWNNMERKQFFDWIDQIQQLPQTDLLTIFKQASLSPGELRRLLEQLQITNTGDHAELQAFVQAYLNNQHSDKNGASKSENWLEFTGLIKRLKSNETWLFAQTQALFQWLQANMSTDSDALLKALRDASLSPKELQFIFRQFSLSEQVTLMKRLSSHETSFLETYHTDLTKILRHIPGLYTNRLQSLLSAHGLTYIISTAQPDKHTYLAQVLQMISAAWHISYKTLMATFSESIETQKEQLESTIRLSFQKMEAPENKKVRIPLPDKVNVADQENEAIAVTHQEEPAAPDEATEIEEEGVFIENAGLVILWPFLLTYFERLHLLQGQQFKDKEASLLAVYALQYLITGHEDSKEYELYLNKVLCGIKPGTPLSSATLTADQKELSESLLQGVIGNWSNMQETSVSALRETFLVRTGHLIPGEEYWSLKVERKTVDILMETMPWSCSVVQLPWMEKVIHVTW